MSIRVIVVALLLCDLLWKCFMMILGNRSLKNPVPENVKDVYDDEEYSKWRDYTRKKNKLDFIHTICTFAAELILLMANCYAGFAGLFPQHFFIQLSSVLLLNSLVLSIIEIPFNCWDTFVIEEQYGFNRSTKKTFVIDIIKNFLIGLILQCVLVGLFALLHMFLKDWIIVAFTVAFAILTLLVTLLVPVFTRMFNKFTPLEEGELKDKLTELMTSHNYKVRAIEVMDASRRTSKMNAYFTGFGPMKTIVLFDTLVSAVTPDQLCAIFAHELGHGLHKDTLKNQFFSFAQGFLIAVISWLLLRAPEVYQAFHFDGLNYGMAFLLIGYLMNVISPVTELISSIFSRKMEFAADEQAVIEGYGESLCEALKILAKGNFVTLAPDPLLVKLSYSHPPIHERIEAIEAKLAKRK